MLYSPSIKIREEGSSEDSLRDRAAAVPSEENHEEAKAGETEAAGERQAEESEDGQ